MYTRLIYKINDELYICSVELQNSQYILDYSQKNIFPLFVDYCPISQSYTSLRHRRSKLTSSAFVLIWGGKCTKILNTEAYTEGLFPPSFLVTFYLKEKIAAKRRFEIVEEFCF